MSVKNLLLENPKAYYWAGFISADGTFTGNNNTRLNVALSTKDIGHLEKLSKYIGSNLCTFKSNHNNSITNCTKQDKDIIPLFKSKFDFKSKKTYNPPKINIKNDDLFISYLIGFIDGDGYIGKQSGNRKDHLIQFKIHKNWKNNLLYFNKRIQEIINIKLKCKPNDAFNNCVKMTWANKIVVKYLKNKTEELKLPVLQRKWDKICLME
jgi:hypothetical protein